MIRLVELTHGVPFGEALALLRRWSGLYALLSDAIQFYQVQLHRHLEAIAYLAHRGVRQPDAVEQMRIGYAPGRCLRARLMRLCYSLRDLQQAGSVNSPRFEAFLASLYADADARERFITDPEERPRAPDWTPRKSRRSPRWISQGWLRRAELRQEACREKGGEIVTIRGKCRTIWSRGIPG